jgi:hypothetical protein
MHSRFALCCLPLLLSLAACGQPGAGSQPAAMAAAAPADPTRAAESPADAAGEVQAAAPVRSEDDRLIIAKVSTGLAADSQLTVFRFQVECRGGVVTLRGPAPTAAVRARAEEIARNVQGVTAVVNRLDVQAG